MKFQITIKDFVSSLEKIIKIPTAKTKKDSDSVSEFLYLSIRNGTLLMSVTGSEIVAYVTCSCGGESGSALIEAKKLFNLLTDLDQESTLESKIQNKGRNDYLVLQVENKTYKFRIAKEEFPPPKVDGYYVNLEVDGEELNKLLVKGAWATKKLKKEDRVLEEDSLVECISFEFDDNLLKCISTDLRKAAVSSIAIENTELFNVIVPEKTIKVLVSVLAKFKPKRKSDPGYPDVKISYQEGFIRFKIEDINYVSETVQGVFPIKYSDLPIRFVNSLELDRKELLGAVKRLNAFTDKIKRMVLLKVNRKKTIIESFNIADKEPSSEVLTSNASFTETIGIGGEDLEQILRRIEDETVKIKVQDGPLKLVQVVSSDPSYCYYLQTLRTD